MPSKIDPICDPDCQNAELQERHEAASVDPFPTIQPALLNSSDISNYIKATGLLHPFYPKKLKPASYEAAIKGQCIFWDEDGNQQLLELTKKGQQFTLAANSIAFVQVEPCFHLPNYIALRFNLKIRHVHRGILLGTGPLIDPGYRGKLLVPLHNLTTNPYTFLAEEDLIWIEFTKTSPHKEWDPNYSEPFSNNKDVDSEWKNYHTEKIIKFPQSKIALPPQDFLAKASPHRPIRSSIPDVIRQSAADAQAARDEAARAKAEVERIRNYIGIGAIVASAGIGLPIFSLVQDAVSLDTSQVQLIKDVNSSVKQQDKTIEDQGKELRQKLNNREQEFNRLQDTSIALQAEMKQLRSQVETLQGRLDNKISASVPAKNVHRGEGEQAPARKASAKQSSDIP